MLIVMLSQQELINVQYQQPIQQLIENTNSIFLNLTQQLQPRIINNIYQPTQYYFNTTLSTQNYLINIFNRNISIFNQSYELIQRLTNNYDIIQAKVFQDQDNQDYLLLIENASSTYRCKLIQLFSQFENYSVNLDVNYTDVQQLVRYQASFLTDFQVYKQGNTTFLAVGSQISIISLNVSNQNVSVQNQQGIIVYQIDSTIVNNLTLVNTVYALYNDTIQGICNNLYQSSQYLICSGHNTQFYYIDKDQITTLTQTITLQLSDSFNQQLSLNILGIQDDILYIRQPPQNNNETYQIVGYQFGSNCQLIPYLAFQNDNLISISEILNNPNQQTNIKFISSNKDRIIQFEQSDQSIQYSFVSSSGNNQNYTVYLLNQTQIYNTQVIAQTSAQSLYQQQDGIYGLTIIQNSNYRDIIMYNNTIIIENILIDDLRFCQLILDNIDDTYLIFSNLSIDQEGQQPNDNINISFEISQQINCNMITSVFNNGYNVYMNLQQEVNNTNYICTGQLYTPSQARDYIFNLYIGEYQLQGDEQQITIQAGSPQTVIQAMISPSIIRNDTIFKLRATIGDKYQNRITINQDICQQINAQIFKLTTDINKYNQINGSNSQFYKTITFINENNVCIFEDSNYDIQHYAVLINFNDNITVDTNQTINYQTFESQVNQNLMFTICQYPEVFQWKAPQIFNIIGYIIFMLIIMILLPYVLYYIVERDNIIRKKQEQKIEIQQALQKKQEELKQTEQKIQGLGVIEEKGQNIYQTDINNVQDNIVNKIQLNDDQIKYILDSNNWNKSKYSKYINIQDIKYEEQIVSLNISIPKIPTENYVKQIVFYSNLKLNNKVQIIKTFQYQINNDKDNIIDQLIKEIDNNKGIVITIFQQCQQLNYDNNDENIKQQINKLQQQLNNMKPKRIFEQIELNIFKFNDQILFGIPPAQNEKYLVYGIQE